MTKLESEQPFRVGMIAFGNTGEALAERMAREANEGGELAAYWMDRLISKGVTPKVLTEVGTAVRNVRRVQGVVPDMKAKRFVWETYLPESDWIPSIESAFALIVVKIINEDVVPKLHRCEHTDCRKYFVGDVRARWCSNSCGSKYRQKLYRERMRQR